MKKIIKLNLLFLSFILFTNAILAQQSLSAQNLNISFGQTINESQFHSKYLSETTWSVKEVNSGNIFSAGSGQDLYNLNFSNPGTYSVEFLLNQELHAQHEGECFHSDLPETLQIIVSDKRITYFTNQVTFSNQIKGGESSEGIVLSIPVEVSSFNGESVEIQNIVKSTGLNSDIKGILDFDQSLLMPGNYVLKFKLSGFASINTYISFDFVDVNNNVFSYYHLSEIK